MAYSIRTRDYLVHNWRLGLPWWFSGQDSTLPIQGAQARSVVGELNPTCMPQLKKKKKKPGS